MAWNGDFATFGASIERAPLHIAERMVIAAARGWWACGRAGGLAMARLAVAGAGLPDETMMPLATALGALGAFARSGRPHARDLDAPGLDPDEATLLDALAALQCGADRDAIRLVGPWFASPLSRGIALAALQDLADALRECGCRLPGGRAAAPSPSGAKSRPSAVVPGSGAVIGVTGEQAL